MAASARRGAARAAQLARPQLLGRPSSSWNLSGDDLASLPALEPVAGRHAFFLPANVKARVREPELLSASQCHTATPITPRVAVS